MNKFLELAFANQVRNDEVFAEKMDECFEPLIVALQEKLSENACNEIIEVLGNCQYDAMYLAGVMGMELAIGVMNGTIEQTIEM